ncbi:MAG TPA: F0F1 ATP synthase subunit alpha, partial [Acidimicrobiia bacterium]|nr:F0F1 ATP synthase subunit alpha [Acidimicrobiia bacterium]
MAEISIDPGEITSVLERHLADYQPTLSQEQVGHVVQVGDGIARVEGLPGAAVNELLEFPGGLMGLALNLDERTIGAAVLGDTTDLEEGDAVRATGRILNIPVGDELLG